MVLAGRTKLRVSKSFCRGISFCVCWISLQLQPQNRNKKYEKLYFNFSCCKPLELAGWFTAFNLLTWAKSWSRFVPPPQCSTKIGTPAAKNVIAQAGFTLPGTLGTLGSFRNILQSKTGENQKKSYDLCTRPLALCHMVNPTLVIALRS